MNPDTLGVPPDIQLASSDPLAWEERWQQVFPVVNGQRTFALPPAAWTVRTLATSTNMQGPKHRDDVIRCTRSLRKTLCDIQAKLTSIAVPFFLGNDLQDRWMSAAPSRRGEIILAGLIAACTTVPSLHDARWFCDKEMRVESHRQNGRLFLDLLEEMMVQNPTAASPDTPTYVAHPVWDAIAADQQASNATICEKIALADILSERNLLIGFVIHFALCSILGLPTPELIQTKIGSKPGKSAQYHLMHPIQAELRTVCGEATAQEFGEIARQLGKGVDAQRREVYATGKRSCQTCLKPNDTTKKYPRCKRCWDTMKREVLYCSSECQKVDWKAGHKNECGKWLQLEDLTPSAPEQHSPEPKIGPPVSGFKRSGALIFQVSHLNQLSPDYDYIILLEYDRVYVSFSHPPIRAAFCACRNKAMTTGDRRAVGMLAHFLLFMYYHHPRLQQIGVVPGAMLGQMLTEFEFPDILRAANEMEQRMYLDEGQRPPLILDGGVSVAEWNAIPSTWLDVGVVPLFELGSVYANL